MTLEDISEQSCEGRLTRHVEELQRFYGLLPMPPADPFAVFAWEVLARKALPAGRDAAMASLRRLHVLTPDAVARAPRAILEAAVAPAGSSIDLRLDALRAGAEVFRRHRMLSAAIRGPLFTARRSLRLLGQLGAAGRHRMLLFSGGHAIVPVDAAITRVAMRLGYVPAGSRGPTRSGPASSVRSVRRELSAALRGDVEACRRAFLYLSHHAALTCTERDPHCRVCPLAVECPSAVQGDAVSGSNRT